MPTLSHFLGEENTMPMNHEEFLQFVVDYESKCDAIFDDRATKYGSPVDRLIQFFDSAKDDQCSPMEALRRMMSKHWTMMISLCRNEELSVEKWDECLMDLHNYSLLAAALIRDKRIQSTTGGMSGGVSNGKV